MIMNLIARLIPLCVVVVLILWFFRAPESVAALIGGFIGMLADGADSVGRFVTAMTPVLNGLL